MQFLIRTDVPFSGTAQSVLLDNGTVAWSGGLTVEEYSADRGFPVRVVTDEEMAALVEAHTATMITGPELITAERWDDMLNCLPPCRWHRRNGVELFHISERITHDLVNWCAKVGDHHFTMVDRASADSVALATAVHKAVAAIDRHERLHAAFSHTTTSNPA